MKTKNPPVDLMTQCITEESRRGMQTLDADVGAEVLSATPCSSCRRPVRRCGLMPSGSMHACSSVAPAKSKKINFCDLYA